MFLSRKQQTPYRALQDDDELRDEPKSEQARTSQYPWQPALMRTWSHFLSPCLCGAVIATILIVLFLQHFVILSRADADEIYHSMVPKFPVEIKRFTHDEIYASTGPEADAAWHALAGPTINPDKLAQQGFVRVDADLRYATVDPGYMIEGNQQKYGISMYHQLHCLAGIRKTVLGLLDGSLDTEEFMSMDQNVTSSDFFPNGHGFWHLKHCFDYVRQALQCAGDMSLEWPTMFNGRPLVVGWNMPHKCMNWDHAWQWMEENA